MGSHLSHSDLRTVQGRTLRTPLGVVVAGGQDRSCAPRPHERKLVILNHHISNTISFDGLDFADLEVLDISEVHDAVALPETGASSGSSSCDSHSTCGSTSTCCI